VRVKAPEQEGARERVWLLTRLCPLISRLMGRDVPTTDVCYLSAGPPEEAGAGPVYLANTPNRKPHFFGRF